MINNKTKILGLFGYPVEHSISPLLHNTAANEYDLNYIYHSFAVKPEKLKDAVDAIKVLGIRGVNVTVPHKEKVTAFLDELDPLAEKIAAVNTIKNEKGRLIGYNTDVSGFRKMLKRDGNFKIKGSRSVVVGAGGAARAVIFALCQGGASEISIINRTEEKAKKLAALAGKYFLRCNLRTLPLIPSVYSDYIKNTELIVDTTPVGMSPDINVKPVLDLEGLRKNTLVVDLVYNPQKTTILKEAEYKGGKILNGMKMLLYQGADSFYLWTDIEINIKLWYNVIK